MSFPYPPRVDTSFPGGGGTSPKSALLTPPITPLSVDDIPYRVAADDNVSLNMRKGKHTCARSCTKAYSGKIPISSSFGQAVTIQSVSKGYMRRHNSVPVSPGSAKVFTSPPEDMGRRNRRWTLPSKSAPTRGFTPLRSTVKQATLSDSIESPAMITLRRATTNKSPRRNELTFFPEPKFGNETNGLLAYFISTLTRANLADMAAPLFADGKSSGTNSAGGEGANPTLTYPAATVCTETTVESNLVSPGYLSDKPSARRCSAKYMAGDTGYEVIWDENDSPTTQSSSRPSVTDRKASMAVMKLESQLARSERTSRRASGQSSGSSSLTSSGSAKQIYAHALTLDKLEQIFPRLLHKTGICDLPKSRTGRKRRDTVCSITVDEPEQQTLAGRAGRKASTFTIDFFPPLTSTASRRASVFQDPAGFRGTSSPHGKRASHGAKGASPESNVSPTKHRPGCGSMIGSSSHTRRRCPTSMEYGRRESVVKQLAERPSEHISEEQDRESDTAPLLGVKAERRVSHRQR